MTKLLVVLACCCLLRLSPSLAEVAAVACEDEHLDCPERAARGECLGRMDSTGAGKLDISMAARALARCRASCRRTLQGDYRTAYLP